MTIGLARLALHLPDSHSLKDKRMVVRRLRDRLRERFNVSAGEVAEHDVWQTAVVGLALVGADGKFVGEALDEVVRFVERESLAGRFSVTRVERDVQSYGDELASTFRHWEP